MELCDYPGFGGNAQAPASAVNDAGVVVGDSYVAPQVQHAIIFDTIRGLRDLNNLIPPGTGWELISATDINNAGKSWRGRMAANTGFVRSRRVS